MGMTASLRQTQMNSLRIQTEILASGRFDIPVSSHEQWRQTGPELLALCNRSPTLKAVFRIQSNFCRRGLGVRRGLKSNRLSQPLKTTSNPAEKPHHGRSCAAWVLMLEAECHIILHHINNVTLSLLGDGAAAYLAVCLPPLTKASGYKWREHRWDGKESLILVSFQQDNALTKQSLNRLHCFLDLESEVTAHRHPPQLLDLSSTEHLDARTWCHKRGRSHCLMPSRLRGPPCLSNFLCVSTRLITSAVVQ